MEADNFLQPDYQYIIVSKLTDEITRVAVQAFIDEKDDSYWLKLYDIIVIVSLEIKDVNEILYREKQESIELDVQIKAKSYRRQK